MHLLKLTIAMAMLLFISTENTVVNGFAPTLVTSTSRPTPTSLHLFGAKQKTAPSKASSPLLEEALSAYPFKFRPENEAKSGTKASCTAAFNELARLYGDEAALNMVTLMPGALKFNTDNFAPCLDAWTEQFGLESAQGMVGRNPGLLGVSLREAEAPAEASMALSYVVAATRPLPKILALGLVVAIATAGFR